MWEVWANKLLPQALKSYPKYNKSPNLVTLGVGVVKVEKQMKKKSKKKMQKDSCEDRTKFETKKRWIKNKYGSAVAVAQLVE